MSMPAGWYPDPFSSSGYLRWWDGQRWGPSQVAGERPPGLAPDEPTPMPPPPTSGSVTGPESGIAFASWGSRAVARIIDSLIEGLLAAPFLVILLREPFDHLMSALRALPAGTTQVPAAVMNDFVSSVTGKTLAVTAISVIVSLVYTVPQNALWNRTIGKRAVAIRIRPQRADGVLGWGTATIRWGAYTAMSVVTSLLLIVDVLWPLWDRPWHQALHDKVARTIVERVPRG